MPETIDIPGGTAEMYTMDELTPKLSMPLNVHTLRCSTMMAKLQTNAKDLAAIKEAEGEGDPLALPDVGFTDQEAEQFLVMQYLAAFVYLKSWTLGRPVPASVDELMGLPMTLVTPLVQYAGRETTQAAVEDASLVESEATVADPESPTSPSEPSEGQSDSTSPVDASTPGDADGSTSTSS